MLSTFECAAQQGRNGGSLRIAIVPAKSSSQDRRDHEPSRAPRVTLTRAGHEVLVFAPEPAVPEHAWGAVVGFPSLPFPPYPGLARLPDPRILLRNGCIASGRMCCTRSGPLPRPLAMPPRAALRIPVVCLLSHGPAGLPAAVRLGFAQRWPPGRCCGACTTPRSRICVRPGITQRELREHGIENVGFGAEVSDTASVPSR